MLITLNSIIPFVVVYMNVTFCFVYALLYLLFACKTCRFRVPREVVAAIQQNVKHIKNIELKLLSVYNKKKNNNNTSQWHCRDKSSVLWNTDDNALSISTPFVFTNPLSC